MLATEDNPQDAEGWYTKGLDLRKLGRYDEAIKAFDEAIRLDPQDENAWFAKGDVSDRQFQYDDTIEAYDEVIRSRRSFRQS